MGKIDGFLSEAVKILLENPKRGKSAERYEKYKHAKTLGEVLDLGGSRADVANDVVRGFIVLKDKKVHKQLLAVLNDKGGSEPYAPPRRVVVVEEKKPAATQQQQKKRKKKKYSQPPPPKKKA